MLDSRLAYVAPTTQQSIVRVGLGARDIGVRELPTPVPTGAGVLLAVHLCGLCGSDAHIWRGDDGYEWVGAGRVLGHEVVGTIAALGDSVDARWRLGDRVVPIAQTGCGHCPACARDYANGCRDKTTLGLSRDGGAAAFALADSRDLIRIPDLVPDITAVLTEPASVAARAIHRGRIAAGDQIVISGPGTIGILAAVLAKDAGAEVVILGTAPDLRDRSATLSDLGIQLNSSVPKDFEPTIWIEAAGAASALQLAAETLPVQGRLVVVALYDAPPLLAMNALVRREIDLITSYSSFRGDYESAVRSLTRHPQLGAALVATYDFSDVTSAFDAIGGGVAAKVAVRPPR